MSNFRGVTKNYQAIKKHIQHFQTATALHLQPTRPHPNTSQVLDLPYGSNAAPEVTDTGWSKPLVSWILPWYLAGVLKGFLGIKTMFWEPKNSANSSLVVWGETPVVWDSNRDTPKDHNWNPNDRAQTTN